MYGQKIGLSGSDLTTFDRCVAQNQHSALVEAMTDDASKDGIISTPTVLVNGHKIDNTLEAYQAAVAEALENGPAPKPSVTPSPTDSSSPSGSSSSSPSAAPSTSSSKPRKSGSPKK
jgi:hypothetical protein